jgi:hypothetical protein
LGERIARLNKLNQRDGGGTKEKGCYIEFFTLRHTKIGSKRKVEGKRSQKKTLASTFVSYV